MPKSFHLPLLLLLASAPIGGAIARTLWYISPPDVMGAFDAAVLARPALFALHVLTACLLAVLGVWQVTRRRKSHRRLGYIAWGSGVIMGVTGIWLVLGFPMNDGSEPATQAVRLVFGALTLWWCFDGLCAALRRDIPRHRAQMLRLYVFATSATTNAMLIGAFLALGGALSARAFTWLLLIGWLGSLAAAEIVIRRRSTPQPYHRQGA